MEPAIATPVQMAEDPAVQMAREYQEPAPDPLERLKKQMTPEQLTQFEITFSGMNPNEKAAFIKRAATEFGSIAGDQQADMTRADALRQNTPQGRTAGGVYRSAHPLEHIGQVMGNRRRRGEYETAQTGRDDARAEQTKRNEERLGLSLPEFLRQR